MALLDDFPQVYQRQVNPQLLAFMQAMQSPLAVGSGGGGAYVAPAQLLPAVQRPAVGEKGAGQGLNDLRMAALLAKAGKAATSNAALGAGTAGSTYV